MAVLASLREANHVNLDKFRFHCLVLLSQSVLIQPLFSCVWCISWLREYFLGAFASLREVNYVNLGKLRYRREMTQLTEHQERSWPLQACF